VNKCLLFANIFFSVVFELKKYKLPSSTKIAGKIYPVMQRKVNVASFNIYDYETIFNDEATKKIIREGNTIGCFYIESPGMRSLLKKLNCDTFEMLTAASSVIRPGVAESGMMQEFIARHKNPALRKYLVPAMEKYLSETYGVMIYQEDVIKIVHHIAGLSLEEADLLRRAMSGKMRSHKAMAALQSRFENSCRQKGLTKYVTKKLWEQIASFAGYAFSKAHSASYAVLSFQIAYLKAHYPAEFMANVLNNGGGFYSACVYINEIKRMGIKILLPSINNSLPEYTGKNKTIRMGLNSIKNFTRTNIIKIINERKKHGKYLSLIEFLIRTEIEFLQVRLLIKCGAMDCLKQTRPTLMRLLDVYSFHKKILFNKETNLFPGEMFRLGEEVITNKQYSIEEICSAEYEAFGFMVSRHPLEFYKNIIDLPYIVKAADIYKYPNQKIKLIGWLMASKRIRTKKGKIMKFLSLEDLSGTFEAVIFPQAYEKFAELTMSMGPYLVEGKADLENGNNIIVEQLQVISGKEALVKSQKDSAEDKYSGDKETVWEEEFSIVKKLGKEKLRHAYVGV